MNKVIKTLIEKKDFISAYSYIPSNMTYTGDDNTSPPLNTFSYINSSKKVVINSSSSQRGYFTVPLGKVNIFDIVEVQVEIRVIDGARPVVSIISEDNWFDNSITVDSIYTSNLKEEWQTVRLKAIIPKNGFARCDVGLTTYDAGICEIRNVEVTLHTARPSKTGARVTATTNQSVPSTTSTPINFSMVEADTGNHFNIANPNRLTVYENGLYLISVNARMAANSTGIRNLILMKNLTTSIQYMSTNAPTAGGVYMQLVCVAWLNATDYVTVSARQDSGISLNLEATDNLPTFSIVKL